MARFQQKLLGMTSEDLLHLSNAAYLIVRILPLASFEHGYWNWR